jgi:uncharacterized membrane protein
MLWLFLALLALFIFAITSTLDGILIKNYIKNPYTYLFYAMLLQGIGGIFIFLFKTVSITNILFLFIAFITGFFYVYGLMHYMKSLEFEEISRVVALFHLGPIFVLLLSLPILRLQLSLYEYVGFSLLVMGGFLISIKKIKGVIRISKGFFLMMLTNLLLTGYFMGADYLFKKYEFWSTFAFIQLGILFFALSLLAFKKYRKDVIIKLEQSDITIKGLIILAAVLSFIALGVRNLAISMKSAALVTSLDGFQSIFTLTITLFLSLKVPQVLKEETKKSVVVLKIIAIVLLIFGIYFISVH